MTNYYRPQVKFFQGILVMSKHSRVKNLQGRNLSVLL